MLQRTERRRQPRHVIGMPVQIYVGGHQAEQPAALVDLSGGGMCIAARGLAWDRLTRLQVQLIAKSDGRCATAVARVVRSDERGVAFRFESLSDADAETFSSAEFAADVEALHVAPIDRRWLTRWWWYPVVSSAIARAA